MSSLKIIRQGRHFTIAIRWIGDAAVIESYGVPIGWEMTGIEATIRNSVGDDWRRVVFDVTRTDFADSGLLGIVRGFWKQLNAGEKPDPDREVLIVAEPGTAMHEKLSMTGINRRVRVVPTVEDAVT